MTAEIIVIGKRKYLAGWAGTTADGSVTGATAKSGVVDGCMTTGL